ncbi:unnamed protein product [Eruca vesicaria subsp. sativa]|uniref:Uncharacterized protein n=1 Tax=Eruca vesicaria subsp. sativa TaxID=29727 RepID=A0ABC8K7F4_ERUVS|nr:unnamed protein product [Eruca vesicaria subsp. sativa]
MTTLFPEVGLLYDEDVLQSILDMIADWTLAKREILRKKVIPRQATISYSNIRKHLLFNQFLILQHVPLTGLKTPFRDGLLKHVTEDVLKLAKDGLERRGYKEAVNI